MAYEGRYGGYFGSNRRSSPPPVQQQERSSYNAGPQVSDEFRESGIIGGLFRIWGSNLSRQWQTMQQDLSGFGARTGNIFSGLAEGSGLFMDNASDVLFGPGEGDPKFEDARNNMFQEQRDRQAALGATEKFLSDVVQPGVDLLASLDKVPLDAQSQYKAEQMRLGLEEQAVQLDRQLQQMEVNMQMQNQLYNTYEDAVFGGNVFGGGRQAEIMESQMDTGGEKTGIQPQVVDALNMIMADQSLTGEEKMARVDFVMDQVSTQQQVRMGINDVTANLTDLETLRGMTDVQLLMESGETPSYVTPAFSYLQEPEITADPTMRYDFNVASYVDSFLSDAGIMLQPEQEEQMATWLQTLGSNPDWSNEQIAGQLRNFATTIGVDPTTLRTEVDNAFRSADLSESAWEGALTKQRIEPGSEEMAVAIFQVANMMGLPPEMASSLAESQGLHAIIKAKSNGAAGSKKGGSQLGVGGLSQAAYEKMGIDVNNLGSMDVELGALIRYIVENFQGDPNQALAYFYSTGDWGN